MNTVTKIIIFLFAALSIGVVYYNYLEKHNGGEMDVAYDEHKQDDSDADSHAARTGEASITAGAYPIKLPLDIQQQANIQLAGLEPVRQQREVRAAGRVVDIQPLLDIRSRFHDIQGQRRVIETELEVTRQDFEKLQLLHKEAGNISGRELQQARLQLEARTAESRALAVSMEDIRHQCIQSWGGVLTGLLLDDSDLFRDLSMRKSVLLLVTVEGNTRMNPGVQQAFVNTQDDREAAVAADFISVAPVTDAKTQGATYFFHAPVSTLRTGMNVDVWIPEGDGLQDGVLIPAGAVIWHLNKSWVYVAAGKETFVRSEVKNYTVTRQGWFVTEGFKSGEMIVISGAQMLLSQEFRWSIPDEDDNP